MPLMKRETVFILKDIPRYEALETLSRRVPEVEPRAVECFLVLLKVSRDISAAMDAHYARSGVSRGRFLVMLILFRNNDQDLTPAQIADRIGVTRATMTGLLDVLERDGLVKRRRHPSDRREIFVKLTPKGNGFLKKMLPDHFRRISAMMSQLTGSERKKLIELLLKAGDGIPAVREP